MRDSLSSFVDKAADLKQVGTEQLANFVSDPKLDQPAVEEKWYSTLFESLTDSLYEIGISIMENSMELMVELLSGF